MHSANVGRAPRSAPLFLVIIIDKHKVVGVARKASHSRRPPARIGEKTSRSPREKAAGTRASPRCATPESVVPCAPASRAGVQNCKRLRRRPAPATLTPPRQLDSERHTGWRRRRRRGGCFLITIREREAESIVVVGLVSRCSRGPLFLDIIIITSIF